MTNEEKMLVSVAKKIARASKQLEALKELLAEASHELGQADISLDVEMMRAKLNVVRGQIKY